MRGEGEWTNKTWSLRAVGEWTNKTWYLHTVEYHLSFKRKAIQTPAVTWMNLEDMMLSEINQSKKDRYDFTSVRSLEESNP